MTQDQATKGAMVQVPTGESLLPAAEMNRWDPALVQGFDQTDLSVPVLKLMQAKSPAVEEGKASVGEFYCEELGIRSQNLSVLVLRMAKPRSLFGLELGKGPVCASDDGLTPRAGGTYPGPCGKCAMRLDMPWAVPPEKRRERCLASYLLLLYSVEKHESMLFRVRGTSIKWFRPWLTRAFSQLHGEQWRVVANIISKVDKNERGQTYQVAEWLWGTELKGADAEMMRKYAYSMSSLNLSAVADQQEESGTSDAGLVADRMETASVGEPGNEQRTSSAQIAPPNLAVQLVTEPEMRYTPLGVAVTSWTVGYSGDGGESWFRASMEARGSLAEEINQRGLLVGAMLRVGGTWREWVDDRGAQHRVYTVSQYVVVREPEKPSPGAGASVQRKVVQF